MIYFSLPDSRPRRLSFYLAMEEYVARRVLRPGSDCFFMWQVRPTVIFGHNQVIENEVNVDYCRQRGIEFYRRRSGGGCVYADMSNVMLSYVTADDNVEATFARYLQLVAGALRQILGVEAVSTSNNDLLIGDRKVSGNAIYHLPGRIIAHGTLLYDTDMENMLRAITPSGEKLQKHGVESVRQRITLLKDHTTLPLEQIKTRLRQLVCASEHALTEADIAAVEAIEREYLDPEWIWHGRRRGSLPDNTAG